jgi:hypothetical protein
MMPSPSSVQGGRADPEAERGGRRLGRDPLEDVVDVQQEPAGIVRPR